MTERITVCPECGRPDPDEVGHAPSCRFATMNAEDRKTVSRYVRSIERRDARAREKRAARAMLRDRARHWLAGEIGACDGCADRLAAIENEAVNRDARDRQVAELRERAEIFRYLLELADRERSSADDYAAREAAEKRSNELFRLGRGD